jgi:hypothetical protein
MIRPVLTSREASPMPQPQKALALQRSELTLV